MDKERKKKSLLPAMGQATLSGAVSGGVLGGVERLLSGARKADILRGSLLGAGAYGGIAGGSEAVGSALLGAPEEQDPHAFTTRGLVGGIAAGGAAGLGLGGLMAAGHLKLPLPKLLREYYAALHQAGDVGSTLHGAALGGAGGALAGGFIGRSEGQETDSWRDDPRRRRYDP